MRLTYCEEFFLKEQTSDQDQDVFISALFLDLSGKGHGVKEGWRKL